MCDVVQRFCYITCGLHCFFVRWNRHHVCSFCCCFVALIAGERSQSEAKDVVAPRGITGALSRGFRSTSKLCMVQVAPVAYHVILEPGISQFREFKSSRVHTRTV